VQWQKEKTGVYGEIWRMGCVVVGAVAVALAIRLFLVPNNIVDGGIVGISMIVSHMSGWMLGVLLFVFNLPFLFVGYKQIGKRFALYTFVAVAVMSVCTSLFIGVPSATNEPLLAAVFGGILLGVGVGLVIRYGGSLDGAEIVAILLAKNVAFSVGEIIMFFNIFILGSAGFVFGWDRAMYSLIAFYIAYKMIDLTIEGFQESRSVWIISAAHQAIGQAIVQEMGRSITYFDGEGGFTGEPKRVIFCVMTRLEEPKLKRIVEEIDEEAFVAVGMVAEVRGKRF
jgi:uncharacterized membrane-anchored protein YitT (DUF2179 family)